MSDHLETNTDGNRRRNRNCIVWTIVTVVFVGMFFYGLSQPLEAHTLALAVLGGFGTLFSLVAVLSRDDVLGRYIRWRGRAILVLLAVVLLVWGPYRLVQHNRHQKQLDVLRAAGYPTNPAELDASYAMPPETDDAGELYRASFKEDLRCFNPDDLELPFVNGTFLRRWEPLPQDKLEAIDAHLEMQAPVLAFIYEAVQKPACRHRIDLRNGLGAFDVQLETLSGDSVDINHLAALRRHERLLSLSAARAIERGDPEHAVLAIEAALDVSRSVAGEPTVISQLVHVAIIKETFKTLEWILNQSVLEEDLLTRLAKECTEVEVREDFAGGLVSTWCFWESPIALEYIFLYEEGPSSGMPALWRLYRWSGLFDRDMAVYLPALAKLVEASKRPYLEAIDIYSELQATCDRAPLYRASFILSFDLPCYESTPRARAYGQAVCRIAQTAVAIERFRLAEGALPQATSNLVPTYLDAVPEDPFDGRPLRYKRIDEGYVVYSVWYDHTDNDGAEYFDHEPGSQKFEDRDLTFFVERRGS